MGAGRLWPGCESVLVCLWCCSPLQSVTLGAIIRHVGRIRPRRERVSDRTRTRRRKIGHVETRGLDATGGRGRAGQDATRLPAITKSS
jgi:hypothetical protein